MGIDLGIFDIGSRHDKLTVLDFSLPPMIVDDLISKRLQIKPEMPNTTTNLFTFHGALGG